MTAELLQKAATIARRTSKVSSLFNEETENKYPKFSDEEIFTGKLLGRGAFSTVREISDINIDSRSKLGNSEERLLMQDRCIRDGDTRYAIKKLSKEIVYGNDEDLFVKAVTDLAIEVRYLAVIEHPHVVKMRAMASCSPYDTNYFIIMDRLYDTLQKRFKIWKEKAVRYKGVMGVVRDMKGRKKNEILYEKLIVAYDLASAMNYIHSLSIVYRDLKPDNIGFDVRGDVKIFDFGLCKELREEDRYPDGTYKLTGYTGSLRFMAPEVALCRPYNLSADVFSFGILLWMIITCLTPYRGFNVAMYENLVVCKGLRPPIKNSWPESFKRLLESAWSPKTKARPSFDDLMCALRNEIYHVTGETEDDALDVSQRTNNSIKAHKKK
mmetsp:Transcript_60767/g.72166  ORF Transcript_60767/g.72166 Transcript_60767/m.72166 type:complete len:382 (+) Transcript_60767:66-1211(+)